VKAGARVSFHDPHVPAIEAAGRRMRSAPLTAAALRAADLTLVLTAHRKVDYAKVVRAARRVFDARNATAGLAARALELL
jgi:UDP-N-acetyl-D-glucosamine dehydrogenase